MKLYEGMTMAIEPMVNLGLKVLRHWMTNGRL